MLNFMRKDQQQTPLLILRAWVKYSAIIPVAMPLLFALLLGGFAALMGVSPLELALNFLADAGIVLSPVVVQLWFAAYLMVVIFYGVGRELINLTTRQPLTLILGNLLRPAPTVDGPRYAPRLYRPRPNPACRPDRQPR